MKDWQTDGRTGGIYFHVSASNCCGSFSFIYFFSWLGGMCVFLLFSLCFFAFKMLLYNATLYGHMCVRACCCTATIFAFFGSIFCCAFPWTVFWIFFSCSFAVCMNFWQLFVNVRDFGIYVLLAPVFLVTETGIGASVALMILRSSFSFFFCAHTPIHPHGHTQIHARTQPQPLWL